MGEFSRAYDAVWDAAGLDDKPEEDRAEFDKALTAYRRVFSRDMLNSVFEVIDDLESRLFPEDEPAKADRGVQTAFQWLRREVSLLYDAVNIEETP